jgi:hypothetical protein
MKHMKTYRGSRERGKVWIESAEYEGGWRDFPLRPDVFDHSPSGFEWGYLGSGPAQLALAILCDYLGDPQLAVRFHQELTEERVARWKKTNGPYRAGARAVVQQSQPR